MAIYRFYNYGVTQQFLNHRISLTGISLIEPQNAQHVDIEADPFLLGDLKAFLPLEHGLHYAGEVVDGVLVPPET
jgi:hypothetical protein